MTTLTAVMIIKMTCNDLRAECEKANLDTKGKKADLQQRLLQHQDQISNNGKKEDTSSPAPKKKFEAADLVCPITLELPWNPVTAEDGRVYERSAIEQHIKTQNNGILKSPMTNETMGPRLLPAPQHKNTIEALIDSGLLKGDLVSKWNEKAKEQREMEQLLKKANNGDANAMYSVGLNYIKGTQGFKQDDQLAYTWSKKAHGAGSASATALIGYMLLHGRGVAKSKKKAVFYMTMAAGKGSRYALWQVSEYLAYGMQGMEVDKEEAICGLQSVMNDIWVVDDMISGDVKKAQELLDELTAAATN